MVLHLIGLGVGNYKNLTLSGLDAIKKSEVYLENYTAVIPSVEEFEDFIGKKITLLNREDVEKKADDIIEEAKKKDVAFIVVGDVFSATTHIDFYSRCLGKVVVKIYNNASVLNAIGNTGLDLYKFGRTTSLVFDWLPESPYKAIEDNRSIGLHTLCLLDIKTAEPSKENLRKGIDKPEPPRFMTVAEAVDILLKMEENFKRGVIKKNMYAVGVARLGYDDELVVFDTLENLKNYDFGEPMHSLVIPGSMNHFEKDVVKKISHHNIY